MKDDPLNNNNDTKGAIKPRSDQNAFLITSAQIPAGEIKPQHLAATETMANGDLYPSDGTNFVRLPLGSANQVLTVHNGALAWVSPLTTNPDPLIANALNARTTSDITITAGTSKVVKQSLVVQDDTTNTYIAGGFSQSGWGYFDVTSGTAVGSESVTLPVTFTAIKSVIVSPIGYITTAVSDIGSFTNSLSALGLIFGFNSYAVTTSGFNVAIIFSGNLGATTHIGYSWIATGY